MAIPTMPGRKLVPHRGDGEVRYEFVNGNIVEDPYLGAQESWLASRLIRGMISSDSSGRVVQGMLFVLRSSPRLWRRADVAFVSKVRWPINRPIPRGAAWDVIPDMTVEITSPSDLIEDLMDKVEEYFKAGVRLVWVVYPKQRKVYAYDSPTSVRILTIGDELDGGEVLPGFRFPLTRLFEMEEDGPTTIA